MSNNINGLAAPPPDLVAAVAADPPQPASDLVASLRELCEELRDQEAEVSRLEHVLGTAKARVDFLKCEAIVEKMDDVGVTAIELAARGNHPAARVEVVPHVSANIAAVQGPRNPRGWPEEKRRAAFDVLDGMGEGDLIKTTVTLRCQREKRVAALEVARQLREMRLGDVEVSESVSHSTLGAWLRERLKKNLPLPPLDVIGGHAGRVAQVKP